jgi:hypothetical protein
VCKNISAAILTGQAVLRQAQNDSGQTDTRLFLPEKQPHRHTCQIKMLAQLVF